MSRSPLASSLIDVTINERVEDRRRDFTSSQVDVAASPRDHGTLRGLVRRPARDRREILDEVELNTVEGVAGDDWLRRGSSRTPDGSANPDSQITLMSVRVLQAIEPDASRWHLAGDQLLVDFDLSLENLPIATHFFVGDAELVVSQDPHTGCAKFSGRFGSDALRWVNGPAGREGRYRGVNARVVRGAVVRVGGEIRKA
jgi:MOSC domain-containing protein YiiM